MITLESTDLDDPHYLELVSQLVNNLVRLQSPQEVYLVHIDHWFDHKWKNFSGKTIGALGVWKSNVTVPPFDPGRVVSQRYFYANDPSAPIFDLKAAKPLHLDQWAGHNLHRFLKHVSSSGLFLWYSGDTQQGDRASVMVYSVHGEQIVPWYASFVRRDEWRLNKVKGISRIQFDEMAA